MLIRKAGASDEGAVRACAEAAYGRYVASIGRRPAPMDADFAAQIAAGVLYVAAGEDNSVQGYVAFFPQGNHMFLDAVAVHPSVAGRGIGKALVQFCEDQARRLGFGAVRLYTNALMTDNLSIYPHLGYVEVDRRSDEGFERVFFEKPLI